MKNIKINKIPDNSEILVQYFLMDDKKREKATKSLESMGNPNNIEQAIDFVIKLVENSDKFSFYLKLGDSDKRDIFSRIVYKSLSNNRDINEELELFYRKISSLSAKSKVNTGFIIGNYANNTYKKETPDSLFVD